MHFYKELIVSMDGVIMYNAFGGGWSELKYKNS